jgi:hypothetical protein
LASAAAGEWAANRSAEAVDGGTRIGQLAFQDGQEQGMDPPGHILTELDSQQMKKWIS